MSAQRKYPDELRERAVKMVPSGSPAERVLWLRNVSTSSLALTGNSKAAPLDIEVLRADRNRVVAADQKRTRSMVSQVIPEPDPPIIPVPIDVDSERSVFGGSEQLFA